MHTGNTSLIRTPYSENERPGSQFFIARGCVCACVRMCACVQARTCAAVYLLVALPLVRSFSGACELLRFGLCSDRRMYRWAMLIGSHGSTRRTDSQDAVAVHSGLHTC